MCPWDLACRPRLPLVEFVLGFGSSAVASPAGKDGFARQLAARGAPASTVAAVDGLMLARLRLVLRFPRAVAVAVAFPDDITPQLYVYYDSCHMTVSRRRAKTRRTTLFCGAKDVCATAGVDKNRAFYIYKRHARGAHVISDTRYTRMPRHHNYCGHKRTNRL